MRCLIRELTDNYQYWEEIHAMNRTYHADCFCCAQCGKNLNPEKFMQLDGKSYCENDYNLLAFPKCYVCTKLIFEVDIK